MISELCIDPLLKLEHMWAQKFMGRIQKTNTSKGVCKSDQTKCFEIQKNYPVKAAIFGYLYYANKKVWDCPYEKILTALQLTIKPIENNQILFIPEPVTLTSNKSIIAFIHAQEKYMEGIVIWDIKAAMEVTMNGKPLRRASYKIKTKEEMDVIAYDGKIGKKAGYYGSIYIGRFDDIGNMIPMGTVGGLKANQNETTPCHWKFPCVIEVTYDNIFPDTGLLQFGSFSKIHEDKLIEEVDLFSLAQ